VQETGIAGMDIQRMQATITDSRMQATKDAKKKNAKNVGMAEEMTREFLEIGWDICMRTDLRAASENRLWDRGEKSRRDAVVKGD
jgi:hypothetical protein